MEFPSMTYALLPSDNIDNMNDYNNNQLNYIKNIDEFFYNIYYYYVSKGISSIILSQLCDIISLLFTIILSTFLFGFINYHNIIKCDINNINNSCHNIIIDIFNLTPSIKTYFLLLYFLLFFIYWIYKCIESYKIIINSLEISKFYTNILGINNNNIINYKFSDILQRIIDLHNSGKYRIIIKNKLTIHDIIIRIMRKDNYIISFINKNLLQLSLPWWLSIFSSDSFFLTKSLEWSLKFCILDYMFTDNYDISPYFLNDLNGLKYRFQIIGIIHFILLPFLLIFMIINFFLINTKLYHYSGKYLGPRQWTTYALWKFREFNELPDIFNKRINNSNIYANNYISTFENIYIIIISKCLIYIIGSIIAVLLLFSILNENILLYYNINEHNLLWYLGIFSALYAGIYTQIPDKTKVNENSDKLLDKICSYTHYYPSHWLNNASSAEVKEEFTQLYQYQVQIFLIEVFSVILTPIVLYFSLPESAYSVLSFIRDHSQYVEGVGVVCDYCLFDFDRYGDADYGTNNNGKLDKSLCPNDGKLEKSYINFHNNYPNINAGNNGQTIYNNLHQFRDTTNHNLEQILLSKLESSNIIIPYNNNNHNRYEGNNNISIEKPSQANNELQEGKGNGIVSSPFSTESIPLAHSDPDTHINTTLADQNDGAFARDVFINNDVQQVESNSPIATSNNGSNSVIEMTDIVPPQKQTIQSTVLPSECNGGSVSQVMSPVAGSYVSQHLNSMSALGIRRSLLESSIAHSAGHVIDFYGGGSGYGSGGMPSVLMSVLRHENIDYENDFYWMNQFHHDRLRSSQRGGVGISTINPMRSSRYSGLNPDPGNMPGFRFGIRGDRSVANSRIAPESKSIDIESQHQGPSNTVSESGNLSIQPPQGEQQSLSHVRGWSPPPSTNVSVAQHQKLATNIITKTPPGSPVFQYGKGRRINTTTGAPPPLFRANIGSQPKNPIGYSNYNNRNQDSHIHGQLDRLPEHDKEG